MDKLKLSTANLVIVIGAVLILLGSFLSFLSSKSLPTGALGVHVTIGGGNAWGRGRFLIATIPALLGVLMGAQVAATAYAPAVKLPPTVLGLTWNQIHLVLAFQATIMMVAFLIQSTGGIGKGIGLFLMLIAAIVLLVGAILRDREAPAL